MSRFDDSQLSREKLDSALQELETYKIPLERLKMADTEIGKGGFGTVTLAELASLDDPSDAPITVAVKEIRDDTRVLPLRLAYRLLREMIVWSSLRHENIVGFIGYHLSENLSTAYLVSSYAVNGNVKTYLEKTGATLEERLELVRDSARGLEYLHTRNPPIVHGDFKSMNMLVTKERRGMLCDFGLANLLQDEPLGFTTSIGFKGTTRWCSPQVIEEKPKTLGSDVWGWGCLAMEIMTGKIPYDSTKSDAAVIIQAVHQKKDPLPSQEPLRPESLLSLLRECWKFEPELRPEIQTCKSRIDVIIRVERSLKAIIGPLSCTGAGSTTATMKP